MCVFSLLVSRAAIIDQYSQDFSNPITRFCMNDYPEDGGDGMTQVFNGEKMLIDLPPEMASPTVRVNGRIFFVNELLQRSSGAYFIPERFFYRKSIPQPDSTANTPDSRELYALGVDVFDSDVRFFS
jgi:hypothetical protein